jgi:hypothetical protein
MAPKTGEIYKVSCLQDLDVLTEGLKASRAT